MNDEEIKDMMIGPPRVTCTCGKRFYVYESYFQHWKREHGVRINGERISHADASR